MQNPTSVNTWKSVKDFLLPILIHSWLSSNQCLSLNFYHYQSLLYISIFGTLTVWICCRTNLLQFCIILARFFLLDSSSSPRFKPSAEASGMVRKALRKLLACTNIASSNVNDDKNDLAVDCCQQNWEQHPPDEFGDMDLTLLANLSYVRSRCKRR